ncbi:hypothetical protein TPPAVE_094 [Candidatus Tremblaya phenacola PAVE]|nr:hypothetical protein TPPAVE_094 [Candidatus Tremblaya phenacola PAVE]
MLLIVNLMHLGLSAFGFNNLNNPISVLKVEEVSSTKTTSRIAALSRRAFGLEELRLLLIQRHCFSLTGILDLGVMPLILRLGRRMSLRFGWGDGCSTAKLELKGRFCPLIRKRKFVSSIPKCWLSYTIFNNTPRSEVGVMLWHLRYSSANIQRFQKLRLWKFGLEVGCITNQLVI